MSRPDPPTLHSTTHQVLPAHGDPPDPPVNLDPRDSKECAESLATQAHPVPLVNVVSLAPPAPLVLMARRVCLETLAPLDPLAHPDHLDAQECQGCLDPKDTGDLLVAPVVTERLESKETKVYPEQLDPQDLLDPRDPVVPPEREAVMEAPDPPVSVERTVWLVTLDL